METINNNTGFNSNKKLIWGITLVGISLSILLFGGLAYFYHTSQRNIIYQHQKACEEIELTFREAVTSPNDSIRLVPEHMLRLVEQSQNQISSLLELQFDKLQNDFNFISLWAGIITIVFLIFSIYSIFRSDEMQKQAADILKKSEAAYGKVITKMDESTEKLNRLDSDIQERSKKLDADNKKHIETLDKSYEATKKELTEKYNKLANALSQKVAMALEHTTDDENNDSDNHLGTKLNTIGLIIGRTEEGKDSSKNTK